LALRSPTTTATNTKEVQLNLGRLYLEDGPFRIPLSGDIRDAVRKQLQDNKGALYTRLQVTGFQVDAGVVDKRDLLAVLCEMSTILTSALTNNFGISHQELMAIRSAEPVSIISCLQCRTHLPDGDRRTVLRQLSRLRYLGRFEVGDLVDLDAICELLCDVNGCSHEHRASYEEELRSAYLAQEARNKQLNKMSLTEYLKTREWRVKRNRALIRAGNRCQVCASTYQLDVHHRTYERLGNELLSDLMVLCRRCHQHYHDFLPKAA
jgi:5-methylcytosine-specific restriction endonuclease McrA